jgi:glucosamine--fructose-6-phosphate aminotransferase (isomerizing)
MERMMERGLHTHNEIQSQPEAWAQALEVVEQNRSNLDKLFHNGINQALFTGCGSTYYLSVSAAAVFQVCTGMAARAVPGGELWLNPVHVLTRQSSLLVASSRSGSTSETLRAVEQFRTHNSGDVVAITNYGDQPLAGMADLRLVIEKGQEKSVAQTRSFASMMVAATALCLLAGRQWNEYESIRRLPDVGVRLLTEYDTLAEEIGQNLDLERFYFLGSGTRYGLACEVSLKMKEMTLTHSEPFHFLEFRHGPMSMVNENTAIIGLVSEANYRHERAVLKEMQDLGAKVLELGESGSDVSFESGIPEVGRSVLYLPVLQMMAFYRSISKGLDPDRPKNLTAVVKLDN